MPFLPEGTKLPDSKSNYMKLEEGKNKFRCLTDNNKRIAGWEYWEEDGQTRKPIRMKDFKDVPVDKRDKARFFVAMIVWNYQLEQIQILELTQVTILRTLDLLSDDDDWGDALNYDVTINREGKGMETEYTVTASPPKPLNEDIKKAYKESNIELEALFKGEDPFNYINTDNIDIDELDFSTLDEKK